MCGIPVCGAVLSAVGMAFTTNNVQQAVQEVKDTNNLAACLCVPESRRGAYIKYFIENDPVASWRAVMVALDGMGEKEAADAIRHLAEPVTGRAGS